MPPPPREIRKGERVMIIDVRLFAVQRSPWERRTRLPNFVEIIHLSNLTGLGRQQTPNINTCIHYFYRFAPQSRALVFPLADLELECGLAGYPPKIH